MGIVLRVWSFSSWLFVRLSRYSSSPYYFGFTTRNGYSWCWFLNWFRDVVSLYPGKLIAVWERSPLSVLYWIRSLFSSSPFIFSAISSILLCGPMFQFGTVSKTASFCSQALIELDSLPCFRAHQCDLV